MAVSLLAVLAAYLIGGVPFGYLLGRLRGVNLLERGSGNIGATNAGRVLGRPYAVLVFALDFAKGVLPTAFVVPAVEAIEAGASTAFGPADLLRVAVAGATFLGHLYPLLLGLRGGKGVATGAGVAAALAPVPMLLALAAWLLTALTTRYVSVASIAAALALVAGRCLTVNEPFARDAHIITIFLVAGALVVILKHRMNLVRLAAGTESRIGTGPTRETTLRTLHLLAVGLWFGGALFFNFMAAPAIFASFKAVVAEAPSDRTAMVPIVPEGTPQATRDALASALAGAAVGPIFPRYFALQAGCGVVALATALVWWRAGRVHRVRAVVVGVALGIAAAGWPLSAEVSRLRVERFDGDAAVAARAKELFGPVHLVSLASSAVTTLLAGVALGLGGRLPETTKPG